MELTHGAAYLWHRVAKRSERLFLASKALDVQKTGDWTSEIIPNTLTDSLSLQKALHVQKNGDWGNENLPSITFHLSNCRCAAHEELFEREKVCRSGKIPLVQSQAFYT